MITESSRGGFVIPSPGFGHTEPCWRCRHAAVARPCLRVLTAPFPFRSAGGPGSATRRAGARYAT